MTRSVRPQGPRGPRGRLGARAEDLAARHLRTCGWTILGRNLRVAGVELDILALEPSVPAVLVIVEVRSRSGRDFGAPQESVDASKVARLYRAALALRWLRPWPGWHPGRDRLRVDLVVLTRDREGAWRLDLHLRGLSGP